MKVHIQTLKEDFWPSGIDSISISQKFTMRVANTQHMFTHMCTNMLGFCLFLLVLLSHKSVKPN